MKKPWGFNGHPWLPIPPSGSDLWVTLTKIKIEKVKVKHFPYLADYCKNKGAYLSREIWESSEKLLYALLITHLPTLPTGGQAQAGISKNDYTDSSLFSRRF